MKFSSLNHHQRDSDKKAGAHLFSASQIKMFRACKVCWAVKYLAKIERAENWAATKGKMIHTLLEGYLKDGTPIDPTDKHGKLVMPGICHLPHPGIAKVEEAFYFECDGIRLNGYIDFIYEKENKIIVGDHKSTKNFRYALSEQGLSTDVQANIYALYAANAYEKDSVELNWVYYKSEGKPESKLVKCELSLTDIQNNAKIILEDCEEMLNAIETNKTPYDFNAPEEGCTWYGGCMAKDFALAQGGSKEMSRNLLDDLKKNQIQKVRAVPATEVKEAVAERTEEESGDFEVLETVEVTEEVINEDGPFQPMQDDNPNNFTLLIDAHPALARDKVYTLAQVIRMPKASINAMYKTTHYRFIDFGRGPAALCNYLDQRFQQGYLINNEIVVVDSSSQEANDVLHILEKWAKTIYRGN